MSVWEETICQSKIFQQVISTAKLLVGSGPLLVNMIAEGEDIVRG